MKITKEQKLALAKEHFLDHVPLYQLYEIYRILQCRQVGMENKK